jgi:hypothetical protein
MTLRADGAKDQEPRSRSITAIVLFCGQSVPID